MSYNVKSPHATEFIHHDEILETIQYAEANKNNTPLLHQILEKGARFQGLSHKEAAVLLLTDSPEIRKKTAEIARKIKLHFYGKRIVLFAPLYLSNYCVNGCVYCPFHFKNKSIPRHILTQDEIRKEVIALQDMGHKRLALETGEDPKNCPIDYILDSIKTIYSIRHNNGVIRRVNVNIAATTVENYQKLHQAGIGTYILFQETYNKDNYEALHPYGPKSDYAYHTEAMDRAMQGGIDDVGIGVLFGLNTYLYDFIGLMMHAEHLEAVYGVGPHTLSVPRICPADDVTVEDFPNAIPDDTFLHLIAVARIAVPYTGIIVSTREKEDVRKAALEAGVSQISGGSRTNVGGYAINPNENKSEQFEVSDHRTLDEVVAWLLEQDHIPSFCTACYREGRTGDRFMQLCKSGQIANCCGPNALLTLQEYTEDYASPATKAIAEKIIRSEIQYIPNQKVKALTEKRLTQIKGGERDFRF